jgi:hypothetical protein
MLLEKTLRAENPIIIGFSKNIYANLLIAMRIKSTNQFLSNHLR